jgi:AcrR family transcriptional regulator
MQVKKQLDETETPRSFKVATNQSAKRRQILDAAADQFGRYGYAATSLDAVVEQASCSKSTIYKMFGSKKGLLEALTEDISAELASELIYLDRQQLDLETLLQRYAGRALTLILSKKHIAVVRAIVAESWQFPELGQGYYQLGPFAAQRDLGGYLQKHIDHETVDNEDAQAAGVRFFGLLLWDLMLPMMVGAKSQLTQTQIHRHADKTVEVFLTMYSLKD